MRHGFRVSGFMIRESCSREHVRAICDLPACDLRSARLRSAICDLRSAICDLRSARLRSAICDLRSAICDLRSAICDLRSAICPPAICDLRSAGVRSAICDLRACGRDMKARKIPPPFQEAGFRVYALKSITSWSISLTFNSALRRLIAADKI